MTIKQAIPFLEADASMTPALRLLLIEAAYHADKYGIIRHSQTELAALCGVSRRTVANYMAAAVESGILKVEGHGRYRFDPEGLAPMEVEDSEPVNLEERLAWISDDARHRMNKKVTA